MAADKFLANEKDPAPAEQIARSIRIIRGEKVILDADLAALYGVATRVPVQAVKRNLERFPPDFMFQLSKEEFALLRSQSVTSRGWGGRRYLPYAFTENVPGSQVPAWEHSCQTLYAWLKNMEKLRSSVPSWGK